jgi:uncharacterized phage-associated protein
VEPENVVATVEGLGYPIPTVPRGTREAPYFSCREVARSYYSAAPIANGFLEWGFRDGIRIDPMKIQKLCYFANGYYLAAERGLAALVAEQFEAWAFGPVLPSLYHSAKRYRRRPITEYIHTYDFEQGDFIPAPAPEDDQLYTRVRERVWEYYGKSPAIILSNLTHQEGGAWARAIREKHGARSAVIPKEYIVEEFDQLVIRS